MRRTILIIGLAILLGLVIIGVTNSLAGQVVFEWDANSESDLAGYRLYQTTTPGQYVYGRDNAVGIIPVGTETFTLIMDVDGEFWWVLTAYDTAENESGPSNEVTTVVNFKPPSPPTGCVLRIPGQ